MNENNTCMNMHRLHPVDGFECSECGIILEDWSMIDIDPDNEDTVYNCEYEFKYCPNCGRMVLCEV